MTVPLDNRVDPLAKKLAPVVREMLLAEIARLVAAEPPAKPAKAGRAEADIMEACRVVARAADRLEQAKYGIGEVAARRELERAAHILGRAMRKHGRMPP
jgi:hypothetical protein